MARFHHERQGVQAEKVIMIAREGLEIVFEPSGPFLDQENEDNHALRFRPGSTHTTTIWSMIFIITCKILFAINARGDTFLPAFPDTLVLLLTIMAIL
jgi:hypothetical protein